MHDRFVTADTHLGHVGALRFRPKFSSVEEMDETLIENWNKTVPRRATVYHIGDFMWPSLPFLMYEQYYDRLNGQIILIRGNHDYKHLKYTKGPFAAIHDILIVKGKTGAVLCHYPMRTWPQKHYGYVHLHGHCHGLINRIPGTFDVGVDVPEWEWKPIPMESLIARLADERAFLSKEPDYEE